MGLVTPFPEPDSPELRHCVIAERGQIVDVLRRAQRAGAQLNAYRSEGAGFAVTRLLAIDERQGRMSVEAVAAPPDPRRQASGEAATFVGFVEGDKLQFTARGPTPRSAWDWRALSLPLPGRLMLLKRRKTERTRLPELAGRGCRIRMPGLAADGAPLPVSDIGAGGLSVEIGDRDHLPVGIRIDGCRLDLPGIGGAEVAVVIRHCSPDPGNAAVRRVGCEFVHAGPSLRSLVRRYLALRDPVGEPDGREAAVMGPDER
jgi:hypothetical protein